MIKSKLTSCLLKIIVWLNRDSNYVIHCRNEVPEWFNDEGPNKWIADGTLELLAVLSNQGHSGSSIHFAVEFFKAMAAFKPWGPLTGKDTEWAEPFDHEGTQQNKRCGSVFRRPDGTAYDIDARVFHDGDECYYTSSESIKDITFPYHVPKEPEVIDTKS